MIFNYFKKIKALEECMAMLGWIILNAPEGRYNKNDILPQHDEILSGEGKKLQKLKEFLDNVIGNSQKDRGDEGKKGNSTLSNRHKFFFDKIKEELGIDDDFDNYTVLQQYNLIDIIYKNLLEIYKKIIENHKIDFDEIFFTDICENITKGVQK